MIIHMFTDFACVFRLTALNVGWAGLNTEALDCLTSSLAQDMKHLNISGCRYALTDRRRFLYCLSLYCSSFCVTCFQYISLFGIRCMPVGEKLSQND